MQRHFPTLYSELVKLISDRAYVSAEFDVRKPHPDANEGACEAGLKGLEYTDPMTLEFELRRGGIIV